MDASRYPLPSLDPVDGERWLTVSARLAGDTSWAGAGHVVASGQGRLQDAPSVARGTLLSVTSGEAGYEVGDARFDRRGRLVEVAGVAVGALVLDVFRAPIDNRLYRFGEPGGISTEWRRHGLHRVVQNVVSVEAGPESLTVVTHDGPTGWDHLYELVWRWTATDAGLHLDLKATARGDWPSPIPASASRSPSPRPSRG